MFLEDF